MCYLIAYILFVSHSCVQYNEYEYRDSTIYGEKWCDFCYKNLNSVDSVFQENILYMNDLLGTREEHRLECSDDNMRCRELMEFLWVVSLMSGRSFIGPNPHGPYQIERNKIIELEQWYNKHKHLITIDILRRFYCSLYPPIMDMDKLEEYYDNLFDSRIVD